MLKDRKFLIAISISVLLIVLIGVFRPRQIDWSPTFSSGDKIPYGTYVFYNSLPDIFTKQEVGINNKPLGSLLHKKGFVNTSLIFVQNEFNPGVKERKDLLAFAASGNDVFISAGHVHRGMTDALKIREKRALFEQLNSYDTSSYSLANFTNPEIHADSSYRFQKNFYAGYYDISDTVFGLQTNASDTDISEITVLGTDAAKRPTFIRIRYGRGYVYIHNNPFAFTNYYMLKPRGAEYAAKCLSYLPQSHIIFDESGKAQENAAKSPLGFILSREPLRWAYFTAMIFLLLYVLFNVKRRQRIIPIVEPYKNASLEFTQTVGALYFNQGNHKNIAYKKITYLLEFIRNRYNIDTAVLDEEFARKLNYKSGLSSSAIEHLLNVISGIEKKTRIASTELIDLNHAIEYFKHNCQ